MFSILRRLISGRPREKRRRTRCKQTEEDRARPRANPTDEELSEFERSYAEPQTGELMERYLGES